MSLSSTLSSHPPAQALAWPYLADEAFLGKLKKNDLEYDQFLRESPALYLTAYSFELVKAPV